MWAFIASFWLKPPAMIFHGTPLSHPEHTHSRALLLFTIAAVIIHQNVQ
jgi:hypothetical protein